MMKEQIKKEKIQIEHDWFIEEQECKVRCNNCYEIFADDDELEMMQDNDGYFKGCPTCIDCEAEYCYRRNLREQE